MRYISAKLLVNIIQKEKEKTFTPKFEAVSDFRFPEATRNPASRI